MTLAAHWRRRGSERVLEHDLIALLRLIVSVWSPERLRDTRNGAGTTAIKARPSPKQRDPHEDRHRPADRGRAHRPQQPHRRAPALSPPDAGSCGDAGVQD